ncbi:MAG: DUF3551 domain-containing protein [Pseudorhodoplanes sp.]|nr:DUF3551 domain-containing protein [Pseudorhodoplanes sp.]
MRKAIAVSILVAPLVIGGAAYAQMSKSQTTAVPSDQRYCVKEDGSGTVSCGFATLAECIQAANGREDNCMLNPRITTGSGSGTKQ